MEEENKEIKTVSRKLAKSGKVSYSDSIIIHESSKMRIVFTPFYIARTEGTDLAIKIETYKKAPPPNNWHLIEEKSISMNESTSRALLRALKEHLVVSEEDEDGDYILIKVNEGTASLGAHDPSAVASALAKVLSQEEIIEHITDTDLSDSLANALRGAIKLKEMRSAVAQLRIHLDAGITDENVYQKWCEEHSWAFGNAYVMRDDIREISTGDKIDILLPTVISGYRDLIELKRPDMKVLNYDETHRNFYFSSEVSKAIGQCHRYLDVLHEVAANGLRDHPEIVAYHPRAIIVIGRSSDWKEHQLKALHGLNCRLSGITVMTYDQLLSQGERLLEMLSTVKSDKEIENDDLPTLDNDLEF